MEGDYAYIKEYAFEPRGRERDQKLPYVFEFEEGCVRFVEVSIQANAKKRRMTMMTSRPSKVTPHNLLYETPLLGAKSA